MVLGGFVGGFGSFWVVLGGFGWFRVLVTTNQKYCYVGVKLTCTLLLHIVLLNL